MSEPRFEVTATHDLVIDRPPAMEGQALLSPFVWRDGECFLMLLRAQPDEGVTGRIWLGRSDDGVSFRMDPAPLLAPSLPGLDEGGCEDPTVVVRDGAIHIFYTGVDRDRRGQLLLASGPDIDNIRKRGVAHTSSRTELNTKEAAIDLSEPAWWRLFFEFAHDERSCIGLASGQAPEGPWADHPDPLAARPGRFDCHHLSTGPLVDFGDGDLVMFYNGSDRRPRWCIGWATFDRETLALTARCDAPLIAPPPEDRRGEQIVFASSALIDEDGTIRLYYSHDDSQPRCATIRRL